MLGEWKVEEYKFSVMFTHTFAEYVLNQIHDKMRSLFDKKVDE